jgi:polysaccharide export outer membrane protein
MCQPRPTGPDLNLLHPFERTRRHGRPPRGRGAGVRRARPLRIARLLLLTLATLLPVAFAARALAQGAPGSDTPRGEGSPEMPGENTDDRRPFAPSRVLAGPVDPAAYVLGPGDLLSLEYGGRAAGSTPLSVDTEGRIRVPSIGLVTVGGRTLAAARADIIKRLQPYLPGATLDLRLIEPRAFKVFVLGEVRQPGVIEVEGSARAFEAIAAVGGEDSIGSSRNIRLLRRDGRVVSVDLDRFRRTGDWEANPYLEDGDRVVVPVMLNRIRIFGAVAHPGDYEFRSDDSLATAIMLAGGLLASARTDSIEILRFLGASQLDTLIVNATAATLALEPDDRVYVRGQVEWRPERQVVISGEVRFPGPYAIHEGANHLSDLIRWAGGFTSQAALRNVKLVRADHGSQVGDTEFDRLSRLSRAEMTNTEYQTFRSKLAVRQSGYLIDFSSGVPQPPDADVLLRDGDRVDVGRLELSVRVDGSVQNPGLITYQPGRSVWDYIQMAGGPSHRGNANDARLTRAGSGSTLFARDVRTLQPGDFIFVPEKKDTDFWAIFRDVIIIAGQVATVVLVVHQLSH